jgi:dolichyl-phosphate-mannose-protein mannosyltransferase
MAQTGRWRPDSFINPSLPLYLMVPPIGAQDRLARAGLVTGRAADPLLLGRALSALAGAAAVWTLGRAVAGAHPACGLLAALLLALMPGFVNLCHFATPEPWLMLGVCGTLALAVAHADRRAPAWALGLVLGLAASTKYTAAALLVPAAAAVWTRRRDDERARWGWMAAAGAVALGLGACVAAADVSLAGHLHLKDARLLHGEHALGFVRGAARLAMAAGAAGLAIALLARAGRPWAVRLSRPDLFGMGGAAVAGFLIGTPYAALDPAAFASDLAYNHQTRFEYKGLTGEATSFGPYLLLFAAALTLPLLAAALAGAIVALARGLRGEAAAVVALTAALAPYLLVAASGHRAMRFLAPALPAAAWLAALGLASIRSRRARDAGTALVIARLALGTALVIRLFFVDSRFAARRWIAAHVPAGATVDLIANNPGYAPEMPPGRTLRVVPTLSREMAPADRFTEAAQRYPAEASQWLVLTASYYERFLDHPDQRPERAAFFRDLLAGRHGFEVKARFRQQGWLRPEAEFLDPEIVILRNTTLGQETELTPH